MDIQISLTDSQFRALLKGFGGRDRKIQLFHNVRRAVVERRSVLLNTLKVNFVGWTPTAEEMSEIESQILSLATEIAPTSTNVIKTAEIDSFAWLRQAQAANKSAKADNRRAKAMHF